MNCSIWQARANLRQPGVLEKQVRRMMADSRSEPLVTNFAEQWLYLRDLDSRKPNEILFADFDESLRDAFRHETDLFLDSVLRGDRGMLELLSANYSFVNERLAKHYGSPTSTAVNFAASRFLPAARAADCSDREVSHHYLLCKQDIAGESRKVGAAESSVVRASASACHGSGAENGGKGNRQDLEHAGCHGSASG